MKAWHLVLGTWLILNGLDHLIQLSFQYEQLVMGVIARVAGVLVLIQK